MALVYLTLGGLAIEALAKSDPGGAVGFVVLLMALWATVLFVRRNRARKANEAQARLAEEQQRQAEEVSRQHENERQRLAAEMEALRQQRWNRLCATYGADIAQRIWAGALWVGATAPMLIEMLGQPLDVDERVLKTKTKHTFKYSRTGQNRFAFRIFLEDGAVVGWEDKR
ncbi:MAG: hypothetical protein WA190_11170 [Usitatibacter sp.]